MQGRPDGEHAGPRPADELLVVEGLTKAYRGRGEGHERVVAVDGISFRVRRGELFTLLGPSGCGKTTTLRCIAGLEVPDEGVIRVGDRTLFSAADGVAERANQRGLGMVFQSYAIWPHMDVRGNVAYPLTVLPRRDRLSRREIERRAEEALAVVQLDHLATRRATELSGGQQQRLALARAMIMEPPLLLLDEPLSNLDAKLRETVRLELKRLQAQIGITAVYVTHDQVEALAISNVIAVMDHGVIQQVGPPREIYERPANRFVADFIGTTNLIEGSVVDCDGDRVSIRTARGMLTAITARSFAAGDEVAVSVRPEHAVLRPADEPSGQNRWRGRVLTQAFLGESVDHVVAVDDWELRVRCNPRLSVGAGGEVTIELPEAACHVLPA